MTKKKKSRPYSMDNREKKKPVPASVMARWRINLRHGKITEIANKADVDRDTIKKVFSSGFATPSVRMKIEKYLGKCKK